MPSSCCSTSHAKRRWPASTTSPSERCPAVTPVPAGILRHFRAAPPDHPHDDFGDPVPVLRLLFHLHSQDPEPAQTETILFGGGQAETGLRNRGQHPLLDGQPDRADLVARGKDVGGQKEPARVRKRAPGGQNHRAHVQDFRAVGRQAQGVRRALPKNPVFVCAAEEQDSGGEVAKNRQ